MKKFLFVSVLTLAGFITNAQPPKVAADKGATFGAEGVTPDNAITVEQLVANMKGKEGQVAVKIKGKVTEVCQEMGCWIKVQST
ncbi:MAG: DUF4920 domain-containing protein, partial [Sediminibacterium sp.]